VTYISIKWLRETDGGRERKEWLGTVSQNPAFLVNNTHFMLSSKRCSQLSSSENELVPEHQNPCLSSLLVVRRLRTMVADGELGKKQELFLPEGPGRQKREVGPARERASPWETGRRLRGGRCFWMASS
jgi:hypothetical protein